MVDDGAVRGPLFTERYLRGVSSILRPKGPSFALAACEHCGRTYLIWQRLFQWHRAWCRTCPLAIWEVRRAGA